ncbi:MAG TPA: FAD-binding protein, partial [Methanocorpusculum sp.]|nr:FAD-binding protein [Methanocorpusculum sp.]
MRIIIIGDGIAGLSAAITAAVNGAEVFIYSHSMSAHSQSVMAEGGINAALNTKGENDSPAIHKDDTIKAGCFLADEKAVEDLTNAAPDLVRYLGNRGVVFNRDENGNINLRPFGGQSKIRTAFANAGIGRQIVFALLGELRKRIAAGNVSIIVTKDFVTPLLGNDGQIVGAVFKDRTTLETEAVAADAVVVCSGGMAGFFKRCTGSLLNDGNVTASLFTAGAKLANLEMIQYHPTTITTSKKQMLISESARGEGGRLFTIRNGERWYFMDEWYPEKGSLMPRDVVSRAIYKVTHDMHLGIDGGDAVGLDCTVLSSSVISERLHEIWKKVHLYLGKDI